MLLTSQYLEEAEQLADEVVVLSDGRVAATGTSGQLRAAVGAARILVVLRDGAAAGPGRLRDLLGQGEAGPDGRTLVLPAPDGLGSLAETVHLSRWARTSPTSARSGRRWRRPSPC